MYLTGAQSGKPSAADRMRKDHVGLIEIVGFIAIESWGDASEDFARFFDAFLTAC